MATSLSPVDPVGAYTIPSRPQVQDSKEWLDKDTETLERLLVERWLYRGGMLAVMLLSAIITTYLGIQGVTTLTDMVSVGALLALGVTAGVVAFVMRLMDIRIHRELRRRRSPGASPSGRGGA